MGRQRHLVAEQAVLLVVVPLLAELQVVVPVVPVVPVVRIGQTFQGSLKTTLPFPSSQSVGSHRVQVAVKTTRRLPGF
jgi:hypothetical protein